MNTHTIKESDVFSSQASAWWDESGPFKALHRMNPLRIQYMLTHIHSHFGQRSLSILDIGCGGGLVCEPFARLGHQLTGIDLSKEAIQVAQQHANDMGLSISYHNTSIDHLSQSYDVICLLEILEHSSDPLTLLKTAIQRLKPGGLIFVSTLNRTIFSYIGGILLAENILKWAPKGTHQWSHFIKPSEIILPLQQLHVDVFDLKGITWSITKRSWRLGSKTSGNYIFVGKRLGGNGG